MYSLDITTRNVFWFCWLSSLLTTIHAFHQQPSVAYYMSFHPKASSKTKSWCQTLSSRCKHEYVRRNFQLHSSVGMPDLAFDPPNISLPEGGSIVEPACREAMERIQRIWVGVPSYVCASGSVAISFIHWPASNDAMITPTGKKSLPLLLVHGFDSSCLEFRRLGPKLAALGIETYAVDLLGWGFSQLNPSDWPDVIETNSRVLSYSALAKVDALVGFWDVIGKGRPVCVAGASLGGAAAIELATRKLSSLDTDNKIIRGLVLIDAQGFVDGVGPMASLPRPIAQLGIQVLKSAQLRNVANQMSYFDKATFATDDALKTGRLHCLQDGWEDALFSFMMSGGFSPARKVAEVDVPSLIIWGRQDEILEKDFPQRFLDTIPKAQLQWIENCGHVPHLEKADETAEAIASFLQSSTFVDNEISFEDRRSETNISLLIGLGASAAAILSAAATLVLNN